MTTEERKNQGVFNRPGISEEYLRQLGVVERVDEEFVRGMMASAKGGGLLIKYMGLDGSPMRTESGEEYCRLRLDNPKVPTNGGRPIRYVAPSVEEGDRGKEGSSHCFVLASELDRLAGKSGQLETLSITEGEFKAIALLEQGAPAIGMGGFYSWRVRETDPFSKEERVKPTKEFLAILERYNPQKLMFVGDRDTALNVKFSNEASLMARTLDREIYLPRHGVESISKGIDDLVNEMGDKFPITFSRMEEDAIKVEAWQPAGWVALQLLRAEAGNKGTRLKELMRREGKGDTITDRLVDIHYQYSEIDGEPAQALRDLICKDLGWMEVNQYKRRIEKASSRQAEFQRGSSSGTGESGPLTKGQLEEYASKVGAYYVERLKEYAVSHVDSNSHQRRWLTRGTQDIEGYFAEELGLNPQKGPGETYPQVTQLRLWVNRNRTVEDALEICGRHQGVHDLSLKSRGLGHPFRVIAKSSPQPVKAGKVSDINVNTAARCLARLCGIDNDRFGCLMFLNVLVAIHQIRRHTAMMEDIGNHTGSKVFGFLGAASAGKTSFVNSVVEPLVSGRGIPATLEDYLKGKTSFVRDGVSSEFHLMDDMAVSNWAEGEAVLGKLKQLVATSSIRFEAKHRDAYLIKGCWTHWLLTNADKHEYLMAIPYPPSGSGWDDKVSLHWVADRPEKDRAIPSDPREASELIEKRIPQALPEFAAWIEEVVPQLPWFFTDGKHGRFGGRNFCHPRVVEQADMLLNKAAGAEALLEAAGEECLHGTAAEILKQLKGRGQPSDKLANANSVLKALELMERHHRFYKHVRSGEVDPDGWGRIFTVSPKPFEAATPPAYYPTGDHLEAAREFFEENGYHFGLDVGGRREARGSRVVSHKELKSLEDTTAHQFPPVDAPKNFSRVERETHTPPGVSVEPTVYKVGGTPVPVETSEHTGVNPHIAVQDTNGIGLPRYEPAWGRVRVVTLVERHEGGRGSPKKWPRVGWCMVIVFEHGHCMQVTGSKERPERGSPLKVSDVAPALASSARVVHEAGVTSEAKILSNSLVVGRVLEKAFTYREGGLRKANRTEVEAAPFLRVIGEWLPSKLPFIHVDGAEARRLIGYHNAGRCGLGAPVEEPPQGGTIPLEWLRRFEQPDVDFIYISSRTSFTEGMAHGLSTAGIIAIDMETVPAKGHEANQKAALRPQTARVRLLQLQAGGFRVGPAGRREPVLVFDVLELGEDFLREEVLSRISEGTTLVAHRATFECQFLLHHFGKDHRKWFCTLVADTVAYQGVDKVAGRPVSHALEEVVQRCGRFSGEHGILHPKSPATDYSTSDWSGSLGKGQLKYAALDVEFLVEAKDILERVTGDQGQGDVLDLEMGVIPVLARMELDGIGIDAGMLEEAVQLLDELVERYKDRVKKYVENALPEEFARVHSWNPKGKAYAKAGGDGKSKGKAIQDSKWFIRRVLLMENESRREKLVREWPRTESERKGGGPGCSLEMSQLEALSLGGTFFNKCWKPYKAAEAIRTQATSALASLSGRRLHYSIRQVINTGRMSTSSPNIQGFPSGDFPKLAIKADGGRKLLSADYKQMELYIMAAITNEESMLERIRKGEDLHAVTAYQTYKESPQLCLSPQGGNLDIEELLVPAGERGQGWDQRWKPLRSRAKAVNFGLIYGQSPSGFYHTRGKAAGMSLTECRTAHEAFFNLYPRIRQYHERLAEQVRKEEQVETFTPGTGRVRLVDRDSLGIRGGSPLGDRERSMIFNRAVNAPVQGAGADILKESVFRIHDELAREGLRILCTIHDSIILEVPGKAAAGLRGRVVEIMGDVAHKHAGIRIGVDVEDSGEYLLGKGKADSRLMDLRQAVAAGG